MIGFFASAEIALSRKRRPYPGSARGGIAPEVRETPTQSGWGGRRGCSEMLNSHRPAARAPTGAVLHCREGPQEAKFQTGLEHAGRALERRVYFSDFPFHSSLNHPSDGWRLETRSIYLTGRDLTRYRGPHRAWRNRRAPGTTGRSGSGPKACAPRGEK